jgi:hypothetical protein
MTKVILNRVDAIEYLLQAKIFSHQLSSLRRDAESMASNGTLPGDQIQSIDLAWSRCPFDVSDAESTPPAYRPITVSGSAVPIYQTTSSSQVLRWPLIKTLIPEPYDQAMLSQIEVAREPFHPLISH